MQHNDILEELGHRKKTLIQEIENERGIQEKIREDLAAWELRLQQREASLDAREQRISAEESLRVDYSELNRL